MKRLVLSLILLISGEVLIPLAGADSSTMLPQVEAAISSAAASSSAPDLTTTIPPLTQIAAPYFTTNVNNCFWSGVITAATGSECTFGDTSSNNVIFIYGDSQAAMWIPAFNQLGIDESYKIIYVARSSCAPWYQEHPFSYQTQATPACETFLKDATSLIASLRPAFVFPIGSETSPEYAKWDSSVVGQIIPLVDNLRADGSKVVLLGSIPHFATDVDPSSCLSIHTSDVEGCDITPQANASATIRIAAAATNTPFVNVTPLFCTTTLCPLWAAGDDGNHLIYYDWGHASSSYVTWVASAFEALVDPALQEPSATPPPLFSQTPLKIVVHKIDIDAKGIQVTGGSDDGKVTLLVKGSGCQLKGTTVLHQGAGSCVVVATKAADYDFSSINAPPLVVRF